MKIREVDELFEASVWDYAKALVGKGKNPGTYKTSFKDRARNLERNRQAQQVAQGMQKMWQRLIYDLSRIPGKVNNKDGYQAELLAWLAKILKMQPTPELKAVVKTIGFDIDADSPKLIKIFVDAIALSQANSSGDPKTADPQVVVLKKIAQYANQLNTTHKPRNKKYEQELETQLWDAFGDNSGNLSNIPAAMVASFTPVAKTMLTSTFKATIV